MKLIKRKLKNSPIEKLKNRKKGDFYYLLKFDKIFDFLKIKNLFYVFFVFLFLSCSKYPEKKEDIFKNIEKPLAVKESQKLLEEFRRLNNKLLDPSLSYEEKLNLIKEGENLFELYLNLKEDEIADAELQKVFEDFCENALKIEKEINRVLEKEEGENISSKEKILNITTFLSPEELKETLALVEKTKFEMKYSIPIPSNNESILAYVRLYENKLNNWFGEALNRGYPYIDEFKRIFKEEGVPQELVYLGIVESAFRPYALSKAGALGVWQFMEKTATKYGLNIDFWVDERLDQFKSCRASAKYLRFLYETFNDWHLAIASYNCGEGKILRYLSNHPKADFWHIRKTKFLRKETKEYVPAVLAAILVGENPSSFGIRIKEEQKVLEVAKIKLNEQIDLEELARETEIPLDHLLSLNPSLKRIITPPYEYELSIPANKYENVERFLASTSGKKIDYEIYVVKKNEKLNTIAKKFKVEPSEIIMANLKIPARIKSGTKLLIVKRNNNKNEREVILKNLSSTEDFKIHVVKQNETLSTISKKYGTTVEELCKINNLSKNSILKVGMKLKVP